MMAKMISMQVAVPILLLLLVPKQKDKTPFFLSPGQHNAGQDQEIQVFSEGSSNVQFRKSDQYLLILILIKINVVGLGCEKEMVNGDSDI